MSDARRHVIHRDAQVIQAVRQRRRYGVRVVARAVAPDAQVPLPEFVDGVGRTLEILLVGDELEFEYVSKKSAIARTSRVRKCT